jgi:hypothetical protein
MNKIINPGLLFLLLQIFSGTIWAQHAEEKLTVTILHKDSLFWNAYNNCDADAFKSFFTEDVEFYHDKGGATLGIDNLIASFKNNLCGNPNFRLKREVVVGTTKVYPLKKNDTIYGAILTGEHVFYINEAGKPEYIDGQANFTHLWLLKNVEWKMARVLSYDHHPATYINKRKEITLDENTLRQFTGNYKSQNFGNMQVLVESKTLILQTSNGKFLLHPETKNLFFAKERDLTFEFVKKDNKIEKIIVRENGNIAEELLLVH